MTARLEDRLRGFGPVGVSVALVITVFSGLGWVLVPAWAALALGWNLIVATAAGHFGFGALLSGLGVLVAINLYGELRSAE